MPDILPVRMQDELHGRQPELRVQKVKKVPSAEHDVGSGFKPLPTLHVPSCVKTEGGANTQIRIRMEIYADSSV